MQKKTNTRFKDNDFKKGTGSDGKPFCCVMVARDKDGVAVRDSKDSKKNTLHFNNKEWEVFLQAIKDGEFEVVK